MKTIGNGTFDMAGAARVDEMLMFTIDASNKEK